MLRSSSKVWGIHAVISEEERKVTVGRSCGFVMDVTW